MNILKKVFAIIALSVASYGFSAVPTTVEAGFQCKSQVKAVSRSITKKAARWQARATWRARVTAKHGPTFAVWRFAEKRSSSCKKKWGTYRCVVRGNPCH